MFLKIRATNKWVFNDLKAVLTRKCEHVSSSGQLNETIGENKPGPRVKKGSV